MKTSLKSLVATDATPAPQPSAPSLEKAQNGSSYRTAQTRTDTRQVGGHFKPEVAQTLRLIAVEQDKDVQEILAEALNMVFGRYGKAIRAEVTSGRRSRTERQ
jgi:hypothetical protein